MPTEKFEPTIQKSMQRPQTYALDRTATGTARVEKARDTEEKFPTKYRAINFIFLTKEESQFCTLKKNPTVFAL
jgi:hypothetical protein